MGKVWWQQDVQLYQQIFFAKHAIKKIRKNEEEDSFVGIFCYVQLLLSCIGNISKLLQNTPDYCKYLNADLKRIPNIRNRNIRNMSEHIDERINNPTNISQCHSDMGIIYSDLSEDNEFAPHRTFNIGKEELQFADKKNGIMTLKIIDVENELRYLSTLEPIEYVFERYDGYDEIF